MHLGLGIKTRLIKIIDIVLVSAGNKLMSVKRRYCLSVIKLNKQIKLGNNIKIHPSAKINIINGGTIHIGDNTQILEGVLIQTYGGNIHIGNNCSINPYSIIYGHGDTNIGDNVLIAGHCMIIPSNHKFSKVEISINNQGNISNGITIKDNVWIAHGCSVLDGVTIESGCIIAAGSVVNKSFTSNKIIAGVPAKIIKKRSE